MTQHQPSPAGAAGGSASGSMSDQASQVAQTAKDSGAQVAQTAKESGSQVAQTAVEQVKTVAAEAQQQTRNLLGEAQGQVREQAKTQQQKARDGLRSLGDELRSMASNSGQSGPATDLAHQASQRAHAAADWLEQREPGDLLVEVRRFAQRRPAAFLAGALLAGVLAGRMTRGVIAASHDESSSDEEPVSLEHPEAQPISGQVWTPAVPPEPGFSSPYDQAMAPAGTPGAYVDASPASGAPIYGDPTYNTPDYPGGSGLEPQGRP
jgi:hypothetical protein